VLLLLLAALLAPASPMQVATPSPVVIQARRTLDLIYNMEFAAALKAAQGVIDLAPEHPAGYFYRAATYWQWRLITRQKAQQDELLGQFAASNRRTIQVAKQLPQAQADEAAFYLGAAYGMQARMYVVEKSYLKALRAAKQGGAYLQQCVELNPDWHDAYLGLGLYHYFLARVPGVLRGILQHLIGMQGDRLKGLQELERARTRGVLAAPEAASLLAKIYATSHEKQYLKAHHLLQYLVQRYPNNFDYRYRLLLASVRLQRFAQALQISQQLVHDIEQGKPYYSRQWLPLLRYRTAEISVLQGDHNTARELLQHLQTQDLDDTLRAWVMLRLGNLHDLQGDRQTARASYQRVVGDTKAQKLAARYLTTPFTQGEIVLKPLEEII
jgi:hypothetical protein